MKQGNSYIMLSEMDIKVQGYYLICYYFNYCAKDLIYHKIKK